MIGSMTGYGQGTWRSAAWIIEVQVRSVNHRFCEVVVRLPKQYSALEERVRKYFQERVARGRCEVLITVQPGEARKKSIKIDRDLAGTYLASLRDLAGYLQIPEQVDLDILLRLPDIITLSEPAEDMDELWGEMRLALEPAAMGLRQMREKEGEALGRDIAHRIGKIGQIIETIGNIAPQINEVYHERLRVRLSEMLSGVAIDENRILTEAAVYAEKSNIDEELTRLQSHLVQMQQALERENEVGRKLDFIIQEVNREVNTIGSKASDFAIATAVIEVKSEVEKIREQVQNLE